MKISVIIPVRNEEQSIRQLLDSLKKQSLTPAEIIITDGGSTDRTPEIIGEYDRGVLSIHLIRAGRAFPGRGRNLAAAQASCEWVAFTDGGISPETNWLEALSQRAANDAGVDVVYGSYEPVTDSFFKECAAIAYVPPRVDIEGALMRPRSIASALMRRKVWEAVGGFPEHLRSAEDLLFMDKVERAGFRIAYASEAVVHWNVQPTLWRTFKRFVTYSRNNIRAGLWKHWQAAIFRRYVVLLLLACLAFAIGRWWLLIIAGLLILMFILRASVAIWRNRRCYPASPGRNLLRMLVLLPLIAVLDVAAIAGSIQWVLKDKLHSKSEPVRVGNDA